MAIETPSTWGTIERIEKQWSGRKTRTKYWAWVLPATNGQWSEYHLFSGAGFPSPRALTLCNLTLPKEMEGIRSRISTPRNVCSLCNLREGRKHEVQ